ncbi:DUF3667 domain-containing protein [Lutibacter sp.]|uniref:DUF3667 domain-containing protein n=1 Tax=Lutibacter sp. TaxID=1925666 RepID=UPI0027338CF3|nr:DUF3667 domain-containing protein [Lutibacter sp.]MDP3312207.1 DUF3667 domain-containing protein [Lutibacter sp.]
MSKEKLRSETNCLNCNHMVEKRYCPNCGQENSVIHKSFYHLFIHFFEDLTHYDNSFWRTITYLLFKPAAVSKAYTSGQRLSFLPPMRLYIFTSFITFFLISLFPSENNKTSTTPIKKKIENVAPTLDSLHIEEKSVDGLAKMGLISQKNNDTLKKY